MPCIDKPEDRETSSQMGKEGPHYGRIVGLQFNVLKRLRRNMQHTEIAHELGISKRELATQIRRILTSIRAPDRSALLATVDVLTPDYAVTPEAPPHRE